MRMIVNSPAAVAAAFSSSCSPVLPGESCCAAIPEPVTRAARVAVLGLADRAAVDEQHAAVLMHPRLVGVSEHQHPVGFGARKALIERCGLLLEQVLVHLAGRAMHQMNTHLADLEAQVERQ